MSGSFLDNQEYLRFEDFVSHLLSSFGSASSWEFPATFISSRKRTLSTLQRKHLHTGLIPVCSKLVHNLDPESLNPWRSDHTFLINCSFGTLARRDFY
ncbi:hypothetical protein AMECASPLE_021867 [Ameca splendens]|uniref:Uncharacterized protein n=1 Tax=Ameca splendens TaxID=208324 RepID=A0ABV1AA06_9TELE